MVLKVNEENIRKNIRGGERLDGRDFKEFRDLEIVPNYINETADGSALVRLGDTTVLVGISTDTGEPYPDRPNQGTIITNAELTPMASPHYESGPPGEESVELARVVDRGIRESGMVDLEDLVIEEGEKCWLVFIDVHVLDYDGNLIDAASIGAVTSLLLAQLPEIDEDGLIDRENYQEELPTHGTPMTVTGSKLEGEILLDATAEEEEVRDAWLAATLKESGNVVNMQKGGRKSMTKSETVEILDEAEEKCEFFREKIQEAVEGAK
ncbi:MAG: exosome complex protein Rrp42 [Candidatus Nanohaloarchaea archaeon]|nr:exosome complex protein Rrp42 [Candidatus Nanohaloarchaea archaeon]